MSKTAGIASVIASLGTLPGDWRVGANIAGNLSVIAPNGQITHYVDLSDGSLHPMVGDMAGSLAGRGGLTT